MSKEAYKGKTMSDIYKAMNVADTPTPHRFTVEEAMNLSVTAQGVRFFFPNDDEEMTYRTLEHCVRTDPRFGFDDGSTIEENDSHSDAELWSDVIVPAIVDGRIEYAVWGVVQNVQS